MRTIALIACAAMLCIGVQAHAATIVFNFPITGNQQVPPNASGGTGVCGVTLDDDTGAVSVFCTFSGLGSDAIAAHIHGLAGNGFNTGVLVSLTPTFATSGTITGNGVLDPSDVTGMLDGLTYINLHSETYPGGELRGQVLVTSRPVPAASTWFLIAMAVLLLVVGTFALRRRFVKA